LDKIIAGLTCTNEVKGGITMIGKRFFCIVLAAAMLLASCAAKEVTNDDEGDDVVVTTITVPDVYYVTAFDEYRVFVRAEASTDSEALLTISAGDRSVRLKDLRDKKAVGGYTWYKVKLPDGSVGWVREDVVVVDDGEAPPQGAGEDEQ